MLSSWLAYDESPIDYTEHPLISNHMQRQSPAELESEFILAVAKAFNDITHKEIKPNLCSFAPPVSLRLFVNHNQL